MRWGKFIGAVAMGLVCSLPCFGQRPRDWRYSPPIPRPYQRQWGDPHGPRQPQSEGGRQMFAYPNYGGGSFSDMGEGQWVEANRTGRFYFQEVRRTPGFVELFDPDRGDTVRLYDNMSYHKTQQQPYWMPLYRGRWE